MELALAKLQQAHAEYPTAITGLEVGRTLMLIGRLREAREALRSVSKTGPRATESDRAKSARAEAVALAVEIGSRFPKLRFVYHGSAPQVTVDGGMVADLDSPLQLDPGSHEIVISNHDSRHVTIEEGKVEVVDLGGTPSTPPPPPEVHVILDRVLESPYGAARDAVLAEFEERYLTHLLARCQQIFRKHRAWQPWTARISRHSFVDINCANRSNGRQLVSSSRYML